MRLQRCMWTAFCREYPLLHYQHSIVLNSRTKGLSEASLPLFYAKSLATMETVLTTHFAHFFPSVLISHNKKTASNTPWLLSLKTTIDSSYLKDRRMNRTYDMFYIDLIFLRQKEGTYIWRD